MAREGLFIGYTRDGRIHTAGILRLSEDLPIVIEIVDAREKIDRFVAEIDEMLGDGMVTLEKAQVIHYRHRKEA